MPKHATTKQTNEYKEKIITTGKIVDTGNVVVRELELSIDCDMVVFGRLPAGSSLPACCDTDECSTDVLVREGETDSGVVAVSSGLCLLSLTYPSLYVKLLSYLNGAKIL